MSATRDIGERRASPSWCQVRGVSRAVHEESLHAFFASSTSQVWASRNSQIFPATHTERMTLGSQVFARERLSVAAAVAMRIFSLIFLFGREIGGARGSLLPCIEAGSRPDLQWAVVAKDAEGFQ